MEHLRFISSKLHFILLLGYFKAKKMFFPFQQEDVQDGIVKLLVSDDGLSRLAVLRKEPKDFSYKVITEEIQKRESIQLLYEIAKKALPILDISKENIRHYENLVGYYSTTRLRRLKRETIYIYLICFAFHRYQKINDDLINAFIYHINQYINEAKKATKEQVHDNKTEANSHLKDAATVLQLFINEKFPDDIHFRQVKDIAFEILEQDKFPIVTRYISKMKFDEAEYEWDHYVSLANLFKRNLRQKFANIEFNSQSDDDCLIEATSFLKKVFGEKRTLGQIILNSFPEHIIPEKFEGYVCSPGKRINADKYEFLVYQPTAITSESRRHLR